MKDKIGDWLKKGSEIAGATVTPIIAASIGDASGGFLVAAGQVLTNEVIDVMQRQQSEIEQSRTAAALLIAYNKIEARLNAGEEIRSDDFFRIRTGVLPTAQMVLDGVLTKAKSQYEERKIHLLGNLMVEATFDDSLSADDLSWMIERLDSMTYRDLLITANFCSYKISPWNSNNIAQIYNRSPIVFTQIQELRSIGLLSGAATFEVAVEISPSGRLLVGTLDLLSELEFYGKDVADLIWEPEERLPGL